MRESIQGTFHFHSTYSHDGRSSLGEIASTLKRRGFSFCIMTEHFEDFDAPKFGSYVQECGEVSRSSEFLLIPGMEVDLSGLHTIVFPVSNYEEIASISSEGKNNQRHLFKVLAHPSKYSSAAVAQHLDRYAIDGIELWNQQADGSHIPPMRFLETLKSRPRRNDYRYFFGCDIHNVRLTVANTISVSTAIPPTVGAISQALVQGAFVSRNLSTGIEYRNGVDPGDFDLWLRTLLERSYVRGRVLRTVRNSLKFFYRRLPPNVQHSLNDVKNFVRNKV